MREENVSGERRECSHTHCDTTGSTLHAIHTPPAPCCPATHCLDCIAFAVHALLAVQRMDEGGGGSPLTHPTYPPPGMPTPPPPNHPYPLATLSPPCLYTRTTSVCIPNTPSAATCWSRRGTRSSRRRPKRTSRMARLSTPSAPAASSRSERRATAYAGTAKRKRKGNGRRDSERESEEKRHGNGLGNALRSV
jgi:hypothetical protein